MAVARLTIAIALLLVAGAAHAEAPPAQGPVTTSAAQLNSAVRLHSPVARDPLPPGLARTAMETRFARDATGAVGFLCGRGDSLDERAGSSALGSDPQGRFLGAKLSFAFR